jgi:hypothetical protein
MTELSARLRTSSADVGSMEEAAQRVVRLLYDSIVVAASGERACALVRFYKTHPLNALPFDLQEFARNAQKAELEPNTTCLTLLATVGDEPEWNDRRRSRNHQAIP